VYEVDKQILVDVEKEASICRTRTCPLDREAVRKVVFESPPGKSRSRA